MNKMCPIYPGEMLCKEFLKPLSLSAEARRKPDTVGERGRRSPFF